MFPYEIRQIVTDVFEESGLVQAYFFEYYKSTAFRVLCRMGIYPSPTSSYMEEFEQFATLIEHIKSILGDAPNLEIKQDEGGGTSLIQIEVEIVYELEYR